MFWQARIGIITQRAALDPRFSLRWNVSLRLQQLVIDPVFPRRVSQCGAQANRPTSGYGGTTSTGTLPFTRTSDVWLPRKSFLRPRRP